MKQVDFDGMFTYSPIVAVNFESNSSIEAYPNPTTGQFMVRMDAENSDETALLLYDQFGKVVYEQQANANQGVNFWTIDIRQLPASVYYLHVKSEKNKTEVLKINLSK